jgi:hypothetical protein
LEKKKIPHFPFSSIYFLAPIKKAKGQGQIPSSPWHLNLYPCNKLLFQCPHSLTSKALSAPTKSINDKGINQEELASLLFLIFLKGTNDYVINLSALKIKLSFK